MEVWKRGVIIGVVVVIVLLYNFGGNITGNIVWEVSTVVDNCSDGDIVDLWDEIFVETSSGVDIYKEDFNVYVPEGQCGEWIAFKIKNEHELFVLHYNIFQPSSTVIERDVYGTSVEINRSSLSVYYRNATSSIISEYVSITSYDDAQIAWDEGDIIQRIVPVPSSAVAEGEFGTIFITSITSPFVFYENVLIPFSSFGNNELTDYPNSRVTSWQRVEENYTSADMVLTVLGYGVVFEPTLIKNISNFEFERNSSWNDAFDISEYFNVSDLSDVSFSSVGANNTNGVWINYSIEDGVVSFKPALNFTGFREFRMVADNLIGSDVYSNVFNVTIDIFNEAPNLIKRFNSIAVSRNSGTRINLDNYFEDPDGDDLIYRASGDANLNVTFDSGLMTIWLGDNFNYTTNFRVHANDGREEVRSNSIYVYEKGDSAAAALAAELARNGDEGLNGTVGGNATSGDGGNASGASGDEDDGGVGLGWVLWVVVGVVVVIILFGIWFFILKKRRSSVSDSREGVPANPPVIPGVGGVSPTKPGPQIAGAPIPSRVDSYLKNLNLSKGNVPVSRK